MLNVQKFYRLFFLMLCISCSSNIETTSEVETSSSTALDSIVFPEYTELSASSVITDDEPQPDYISVKVNKSTSIIDFNTAISTIEILLLPNEPLIGKIKDILKDGDLTYVVDGIHENIKVYDKNLSFIRELGTKGNGPGEYLGISQVFFKNRFLHIFSYWNKSIFVYNLNGEFIDQIKLDDHPESIHPLGDNFVGYMNFGSEHSKKPNLILFSGKGGIIGMERLDHTMSPSIGFVGGIYKKLDSQGFYYHESFSNSLTEWKSNLNLSQSYDLNLFNNPYKGTFENASIYAAEEYQYFMKFYNSFNSQLFFSYYDRKNLYDGFVNLTEKKIYAQNQIKPDHITQFISNVRFKDQDNYYYVLPHLDKIHMMKNFVDFSFPQMPNSFGSKLKELTMDEDDKFFIRFKMK